MCWICWRAGIFEDLTKNPTDAPPRVMSHFEIAKITVGRSRSPPIWLKKSFFETRARGFGRKRGKIFVVILSFRKKEFLSMRLQRFLPKKSRMRRGGPEKTLLVTKNCLKRRRTRSRTDEVGEKFVWPPSFLEKSCF